MRLVGFTSLSSKSGYRNLMSAKVSVLGENHLGVDAFVYIGEHFDSITSQL